MASARPDLSVAIVNTNNRAYLGRCLGTLRPEPGLALEIFVVDNASTDGSAELVRDEFPDVLLIENDERQGLSASLNRALERATGRYVMILNEDTEVLPGCLSALVAFMDQTPAAGACGPKLLNPDGSLQRTANRFPTFAYGIFEALSLNRLIPENPVQRHNIYADWDRNSLREVDAVSGAALLVRRAALAEAGLPDPHFFIYSEELDWCYRIHQKGWKIVYVPGAQLIHYGGQSTAVRAPAKFHQIYWDSFLYYYRKHFGSPVYWVLRMLFELRMMVHRIAARGR
jgi:GT2 family glycosyltransferase